jgi:hypothetical protein
MNTPHKKIFNKLYHIHIKKRTVLKKIKTVLYIKNKLKIIYQKDLNKFDQLIQNQHFLS